ncbi:hypothetical protein HDU98_000350 [Podochytrium sp. JEL0797]|nr:hypothetical protein HDU98_000350 [Podochytrium sp. JEL0797]
MQLIKAIAFAVALFAASAVAFATDITSSYTIAAATGCNTANKATDLTAMLPILSTSAASSILVFKFSTFGQAVTFTLQDVAAACTGTLTVDTSTACQVKIDISAVNSACYVDGKTENSVTAATSAIYINNLVYNAAGMGDLNFEIDSATTGDFLQLTSITAKEVDTGCPKATESGWKSASANPSQPAHYVGTVPCISTAITCTYTVAYTNVGNDDKTGRQDISFTLEPCTSQATSVSPTATAALSFPNDPNREATAKSVWDVTFTFAPAFASLGYTIDVTGWTVLPTVGGQSVTASTTFNGNTETTAACLLSLGGNAFSFYAGVLASGVEPSSTPNTCTTSTAGTTSSNLAFLLPDTVATYLFKYSLMFTPHARKRASASPLTGTATASVTIDTTGQSPVVVPSTTMAAPAASQAVVPPATQAVVPATPPATQAAVPVAPVASQVVAPVAPAASEAAAPSPATPAKPILATSGMEAVAGSAWLAVGAVLVL